MFFIAYREYLFAILLSIKGSFNERWVHGIYAFSKIKESWLREKVGLELPSGLPSYDTIRRTLGIIAPKVFQRLFIKWIEEKLDLKPGSYISIDGKSVKGSGNDKKNIPRFTFSTRTAMSLG